MKPENAMELEQELEQVTGGSALTEIFRKAKEVADTAGKVYDAYTGKDKEKEKEKENEITITYNEDGSVCVSGGW